MQVELRAFDSLQRQILLGVFGIILVGAGLIIGNGAPGYGGPSKLAIENPTSVTPPASTIDAVSPARVAPPEQEPTTPSPEAPVAPTIDATNDAPAADTAPQHAAVPTPTVAARLPGRVDIFWCETADGDGGNREAGERVGAALRADGRVGRVRVRPLSMATNARADYGIDHDIVRFDPGERPAAALLANLATSASGRSFAPAPALPGTPSVDYLSVFVCGAH